MFRRKVVKIALVVVGVPLLCYGGYWAWYGADLLQAANDLPHQIARAKALGLPFQGKDLRPNPPVKDSENAAVPIRALAKRWRSSPAQTQIWMKHDQAVSFGRLAPPPLTLQEMRPIEPYLKAARAISNMSRCDFAYDVDKGRYYLLPEVADMSAFGSVMLAHADALTRAGRDSEAIAEIETLRRLGELIGQNPEPICVLSQVGFEASARKGYCRIAGLCNGRLGTLRKVRSALDSVSTTVDYGALIKGVTAQAMAMVRIIPNAKDAQRMDTPEAPPDPTTFPKEPEPKTLVGKAYMARVLRELCDCAEAWKRDPDPDRFVAAVKAIEKRYASYRGPSYALVPYFGVNGSDGWRKTRMNHIARERLARAYVDVLIFRSTRGRLPGTLAEAGNHQTDPYDGRPLRFLQRPNGGVLLWSVGEDLTDDGGVRPARYAAYVPPEKWKELESRPPRGDVVMEYPPVQEP